MDNTLIVFKPTGRRQPVFGDWVRTSAGNYVCCSKAAVFCGPWIIYTRHEIEATPETLAVLGMEARS